jgi:hypothetical protein
VGTIRRINNDIGTSVYEGIGAAGAALNKYVSNPLMLNAVNSKMTPKEVQKYQAQRYIGLPVAIGGSYLGASTIPGIGEAAGKYIGNNLDYVLDHGFDKQLAEKGVNLAQLKVGETLGKIGDAAKNYAYDTASDATKTNKIGARVVQAGGVSAVGAGLLGKRLAQKETNDDSQFKYKKIIEFAKLTPQELKELELIIEARKSRAIAQGINAGAIVGGVAGGGGVLGVLGRDAANAAPLGVIGGGIVGGKIGSDIANVASPIMTRSKAMRHGIESVRSSKVTNLPNRTMPVLAGIGALNVGALGAGYYMNQDNN